MRKHRWAVSVFFWINGFIYANWVARLPEIQQLYGVSNAMLGTLLLCLAAGAMVAMPFSGWLTLRFGSRQITAATGIVFCMVVPLLPLITHLGLVAVLFVLIGMLNGAMDVSMNGQGVYVERMYQRPILSSLHAMFSIGMAIGAGLGALAAHGQVSLFMHFTLGCALSLGLVLWAARHLVNDAGEKAVSAAAGSGFRLPTRAILPLGIIAFCGMTGEGSMADWSAIYMNKVVGKDVGFSALTFGVFTAAMTIGRVFGDYSTAQLGKERLLLYNSVAAIGGLSLVILWPQPWPVLTGFFLVGLGLATVVPIIYSAAGNTPGVAPSVGIAMATTVGYAGFFVGPPVIGYLSDIFNLRIGLTFSLLLFVVMLLLVRRHRFQ